MRKLQLIGGDLNCAYRLAFVGPGDEFEVIARFDNWSAASAAYRAAEDAAQLVLTVPYRTPSLFHTTKTRSA